MFSKMITMFRPRPEVTRWKTRDNAGPNTAILYRMGAGFAGDINRVHPFDAEPCLIDKNAPPTAYGQPVVVDPATQGVRPLVVGDAALTDVYGFTVRPYPMQQQNSAAFGTPAVLGAATPPTTGVIDVLRRGYMMIKVFGATLKGMPVYIWVAASAGNHVQGQAEIVNTAGSTLLLPANTTFNGPADAAGIVEICFHI